MTDGGCMSARPLASLSAGKDSESERRNILEWEYFGNSMKRNPTGAIFGFLCQHCKHFWTPHSLFWFEIFWRTMAPYWRKALPSSEGAPPSDLCFLLTTSFPDLVISCKWYNMFYFSIYPIAPVSPYTQLHLFGVSHLPRITECSISLTSQDRHPPSPQSFQIDVCIPPISLATTGQRQTRP